MTSPLLNWMPARAEKSPRRMMVSTPSSEMVMPASCAHVSRTPNSASDHSATNSGPDDWINSAFSAWVYCRRPVGQRVVDAKAGRRQQHDQRNPRPQHRPVARQMRPGEWQQRQERADPSDAGQRHRRDMAGGIAPEHDIAGPEQRGQAEQQIRLIAEPSDGTGGGWRWRGNGHCFGDDLCRIHGRRQVPRAQCYNVLNSSRASRSRSWLWIC